MFVTTAAGKPHSGHSVLEIGLAKWNIHFMAVPWQILCDTCDGFRAERQPGWKWLPPRSLWWGVEEQRVDEDKSCWSPESSSISVLNRSLHHRGPPGYHDQWFLPLHGQLIRKVNTRTNQRSALSHMRSAFCPSRGEVRGQWQNLPCTVLPEGHCVTHIVLWQPHFAHMCCF